jgi:Ca2+-binding EF-hand superfamily protein
MTPFAVVLCSLPVLFAQETVEQSQELDDRLQALFDQLDANRDGLLTRDELDGNEAKRKLFEHYLASHDNNGDGKLSKAEFQKVFESPKEGADERDQPESPQRPPRRQGLDAASVFSRLDNNQDGKLELKELPRPLREKLGPTYQSLGKDSLTVEEFVPAFRVLFAERRQPSGLPSPDTFFEYFDTNQDDKVTLDEVPEEVRPNLKQMFDQLETEFITKDAYTQIYELLVERAQAEDSQERPEDRPGDRRNTPRAGTFRGDDRGRRDFMRRPGDDSFPQRGPSFFGLLDTDRDGKLSGSELSQASQLVARLDRDEDGLLDPSEIFGAGRGRREGDNRFGPPERGRPGRAERTDDRPDRPQRPALAEEPDEPQDPKTTAAAPQPETAPPRTAPTNIRNASNAEFVDELFARFDGNQDGKLSSEEAPARLQRSFGRLDLDADGAVSKEELRKGLGGDSR